MNSIKKKFNFQFRTSLEEEAQRSRRWTRLPIRGPNGRFKDIFVDAEAYEILNLPEVLLDADPDKHPLVEMYEDTSKRLGIFTRHLHTAIYKALASLGVVRELPAGWHIHHIDQNKFDNRAHNLLAASKRGHPWIHSMMKRAAEVPDGAPEAPSGGVVIAKAPRIQAVSQASIYARLGFTHEERGVDARLAVQLPPLFDRLRGANNHLKMIRPPSRELKLDNWGLTPGEATVVFSIIDAQLGSQHDVLVQDSQVQDLVIDWNRHHDDVKKTVVLADRLGEAPRCVRAILDRPRVQSAIHDWHRHQRVPSVTPLKGTPTFTIMEDEDGINWWVQLKNARNAFPRFDTQKEALNAVRAHAQTLELAKIVVRLPDWERLHFYETKYAKSGV